MLQRKSSAYNFELKVFTDSPKEKSMKKLKIPIIYFLTFDLGQDVFDRLKVR